MPHQSIPARAMCAARRSPVRAAAPIAAACAALLLTIPSALRAQETELVGTLHTIWRDPVGGGPARRLVTITDDKGVASPVELTEALVAPFGGFDALRLRRVRLAVSGGRATAVRGVESRTDAQLASLFTGTPRVMRYVTLLCRFPDFPDVNPGTVADAEVNFGQAFPGAGHYWAEVSDNRLSLAGSVVRGWYMMPQPRSVYVPGDFGNLTGLGRDCAAAADADVDFSQFDGVNFVFNTNIDCCSYGGTGSLALDGGTRGYAMTWLSSSVFSNLGTIAHEIGHSLGLSHSSGSYGLTYDSRWDVMSAGDWVPVPGTDKLVGTHVNAFGKRQLGFIPAERDFLATAGTHEILLEKTVLPAENGNYLVARIPTPRFGPTQYYTLEVRGIGGYDAPLIGAGVVVHRVGGGGATPSNAIDLDGDFDPNDEGALLTPGERFDDPVNGIAVRVLERVGDAFRVRLEVASHPQVLLSPAQRLVTAVAGTDTVIVDSTMVTLSGMREGTAWSARKQMSGPLSLNTTSGTGSGPLRWSVRTTGLAPGIYDQDVRVDAGGLTWTSLRLRVTVQAPTTATIGAYAPVVRDSIIAGASRDLYNAVTLAGPGGDTTSWTVTTDAPWITLLQASGVGNGPLRYTRSTAALAPGMHVAQLTLRAPGTTLPAVTLVDSLDVLEPLAWRVTARGAARTTLGQGAPPAIDSVRVEFDGRYGTGAQWYVAQGEGQYYLAPEFPGPVGSAWVRFRRAPRDLAPGVYPATLRFYLAMDPARELTIPDTLVVTAAPVGIALSAPSTRDTVRGITALSQDSVYVQPTGPSSSTRAWRAVNERALLAFPLGGGALPGGGFGPGWIRFIRNIADRAPGWHVDAIAFFEATGSVVLARLVDSLFVAPGPVPTTVAIAAPPRRSELRAGGTATLEDTVEVTASGDEALQVQWSATASAGWITLLTPSGTGTAPLRWTRSAAGLAPGWHVDTIRVVAPGVGSSTMVIDSLRAYAALAVGGAAQRPPATMGAPFADTLRTTGGPTAPMTWALLEGTLPAGLSFDAAVGRVHGIPEAGGTFAITVRAAAGADTALRALQVVVQEPVLAAVAVIHQLLGGAPLGEDQRRYLDLQGNRNGRVDIGDVRVWRRRQAATLTAAQRATLDTLTGATGAGRQP